MRPLAHNLFQVGILTILGNTIYVLPQSVVYIMRSVALKLLLDFVAILQKETMYVRGLSGKYEHTVSTEAKTSTPFQSHFSCKNTLLNRVSAIFFIYLLFNIYESIWKGGSTKRALGACWMGTWSVLSEQESVFYAVVFQLKYYNLYLTTWFTCT